MTFFCRDYCRKKFKDMVNNQSQMVLFPFSKTMKTNQILPSNTHITTDDKTNKEIKLLRLKE